MGRDSSGLSDHVRVGLALSGGGARGLAQVGVIKVLEREGIPIDLVAGTSIGAVVGGLYAISDGAEEMLERVKATLSSEHMDGLNLERILRLSGITPLEAEKKAREGRDRRGFFQRARQLMRGVFASHTALTSQSVLEKEMVQEVFEHMFGDATFDQTRIPFAAIAVDLEEGCEVIIANGPIAPAVAASSAIAGIFPPVHLRGRHLIDGGYTSPVPIDAAHTLGANVVIAVDVSIKSADRGRLNNAVEVAMRSSEISLLALEREQLRRADVVIPARGQTRHWSDYSRPEEAIEAGEKATERLLESIEVAIEERSQLFL